MSPHSDTSTLWIALTIGIYALFVVVYTARQNRRFHKQQEADEKKNGRAEKSYTGVTVRHYDLDDFQPLPHAAKAAESVGEEENPPTFADDKETKYPLQVPADKLDEAFSAPPAAEENTPLDIDYPLQDESEEEYPDEEESEELPTDGSPPLADGVPFDKMIAAAHTVWHKDVKTLPSEKKQKTGKVLTTLKHTDLFEVMVSDAERAERVSYLLSVAHEGIVRKQRKKLPKVELPRDMPDGFDIRRFM